jgi:hypothetical protein
MDRDANGGSLGPIIGGLVVLAVIILGGFYFWGEHSKSAATDMKQTPAAVVTGATNPGDSIDVQSSSDDLDSIQTDLNNTDTTNVGAGLQTM